MAFPTDLDKDFKEGAELDKLEPLSGYTNALHQEQAEDLSSNGAANTKKFFDYMALRVLIPCINALNRAVLALRGNTSTSLASLEQKLTTLSGNTTTSVEALEKRMDTVEEVSAVSTTKVENATSLAKAAAENVMQKDQAASVLDVVKKTPLYFGSGTMEQIEAVQESLPGEAAFFVEDEWYEGEEHPGCYYRMVDGEREWLNPPLESPEELATGVASDAYRTIERSGGKPVYVRRVHIGELPMAGAKSVVYWEKGAANVVAFEAYCKAGTSVRNNFPFFKVEADPESENGFKATFRAKLSCSSKNIIVTAFTDSRGNTGWGTVWFTRNKDEESES